MKVHGELELKELRELFDVTLEFVDKSEVKEFRSPAHLTNLRRLHVARRHSLVDCEALCSRKPKALLQTFTTSTWQRLRTRSKLRNGSDW